MDIRPGTAADIDSVIRLREEMHGASIDHAALEASCRAIITSASQELLLVIDQDHVVGQAIVSLLHKLPKIEVRIDEVVVDSRERGRGYGKALMLACEKWAREHDADTIEFTSRPSREAAIVLYTKLGYVVRDTNVFRKNRGEF